MKLPSDEALAHVFAASMNAAVIRRPAAISVVLRGIAAEHVKEFVQVYQELHKQADEQAAALARTKGEALNAFLAREHAQNNTLERKAARLRDEIQAKHGSRGFEAGTPAVEFLAACDLLARSPKETE